MIEFEQLADLLDSFAENPKGGKPAAAAYKHSARLIRERVDQARRVPPPDSKLMPGEGPAEPLF